MNKFSVKKLSLTILCSIVITTFIGTTYLFLLNVPSWIECELFSSLDADADILKQIGYGFTDQTRIWEESVAKEKAMYGQDYPSEEILLYRTLIESKSYEIVRMYVSTLVIGIILGTIIYIIAIQNAKSKKLLIELFTGLVIIFVLLIISNTSYEAYINQMINKYNATGVEYKFYIYNFENQNIFIIYIITIVVVYVGNMLCQKRGAKNVLK